jgi:hypothetical protein
MNDPVNDFMKLAQIPLGNEWEKTEGFLRGQEADSHTMAVLKRLDDQQVALLKIADGEATLFSVLPSQGGRTLIHETYIGKVYDATVTQVHTIEDLADTSAPKTERVEITGSRLAGIINVTYYTIEERATLVEALRGVVGAPRS